MIEEKQKLMKKTGKNAALNKHSQNLVSEALYLLLKATGCAKCLEHHKE